MDAQILAILATAAPIIQVALMGFLAYPFARRSKEGMERFHRSGFAWWIATLVLIAGISVVLSPQLLAPMAPSTHSPSIGRWLTGFVVATVVLVLFEWGIDRIQIGEKSKKRRAHENEQFDKSVPDKVEQSFPLFLGVLGVSSFLEEIVFRAVALGGLISAWGLSKPVSSGIVVVCFGLAHWYYGRRQILIKMVDGAVLVWVALFSGWIAAACAHIAFNWILMMIDRHQKSRS